MKPVKIRPELRTLVQTYQKNRVDKTFHPYKKRNPKPKQ